MIWTLQPPHVVDEEGSCCLESQEGHAGDFIVVRDGAGIFDTNTMFTLQV